ncbi:MAG: hypothetical protein PHY92_10615, partial [Alphaproteobacteria bacterium]|nr:hypothetical protein [Alphaproteobacteria bacterium]
MTQAASISPRRPALDPLVILFSVTLFLSAALMFAVQPMAGKMLLPLVGGAPSGWLVAMAFFQLALLAGYYLAHKLSVLPARWQGAALLLLLAVGWMMQPVRFPASLPGLDQIPESFRVLLILVFRMAVPFLALALLSPTLQRLFAASASPSAKDPYFLFAASNLGSFAGLFLYPLWMERMMGLAAQSVWWRGAFTALGVLCLLCWAVAAARTPGQHERAAPEREKPFEWRLRLQWMALAFVPSSLMLGLTAFVTLDVGAVPLFWVLPLALYLVTFVLAFARKDRKEPLWLTYLQPVTVVSFVTASLFHFGAIGTINFSRVFLPLAAFFATALRAHFALASSRPDAGRLTEFYLYVALGGAMGGVFNAFLAPVLFPESVEFYVVAAASLLVFPPVKVWPFAKRPYALPVAILIAFVLTAGLPFARKQIPFAATYLLLPPFYLSLAALVPRPKAFVPVAFVLGLMTVVLISRV